MTILSVNNLTKYYGNICALSNVSFLFPKDVFLAYLAPMVVEKQHYSALLLVF